MANQHISDSLGFTAPDILLPASHIDHQAWAVIACDQYTSSRRYWDTVESFVSNNPSTLRMIIPEVFLGTLDRPAAVQDIVSSMYRYLEDNILVHHPHCPVLVRRTISNLDSNPEGHISRLGLILALDLEYYDYRQDSQSRIRATEKTIIERLPPRIEVRRQAPIEIPHILVFINDPGNKVLEPLARRLEKQNEATRTEDPAEHADNVLYDFDLMQGGGHIRGQKVDSTQWEIVVSSLQQCALTRDTDNEEPNTDDPPPSGSILFAVGDGNHSLAAAKAVWENKKRSGVDHHHPARWALAEVCNLYDPSITILPIHRLLLGVSLEMCLDFLTRDPRITFSALQSHQEVLEIPICSANAHTIGVIGSNRYGALTFSRPTENTATGTFQPLIDSLLETASGSEIDYVHEAETVIELGNDSNSVGLLFPTIERQQIFSVISQGSVFPRKTFSIGSAVEKRYYLECRQIITDSELNGSI